jgi:GNAT superfamily N-acetyltransferase
VRPEQTRRGFGTALLCHCESEAKRYGFTSIEMMATLTGLKLYQTYGYQKGEPVIYNLPNSISINFVPMYKKL